MYNIYKTTNEDNLTVFSVVEFSTGLEVAVFDSYIEAVKYVMSRRL